MPPKTPKSEAVLDPCAQAILHILATQGEAIRIDGTEMAKYFGLNGAKNVGRKLDSLVKPFGYKYAASKIVAISDTATTSKDGDLFDAKPASASINSDAEPKTPVKKTAAKKKAATPKSEKEKKGPTAKKRKIEEVENEVKDEEMDDTNEGGENENGEDDVNGDEEVKGEAE